MIITLTHQTISGFEMELKSFFRAVPFGRYLSDRKLDNNQAVNFEYDLLVNYLLKGEIWIVIDDKNKLQGLIGFHFSEWDTNVFHRRMAILQYFLVKEYDLENDKSLANLLIDLFHKWTYKNGIEVVITKMDTKYFTPVLVLQERGYIFYETNTFRSIGIEDINRVNLENLKYRFADRSDVSSLKNLALKNTFNKSHFYLDSHFDIKHVEKMYSLWIDNALKSSQRVLVIEDNGEIAGVFIYENLDLTRYFGKKIGAWKFAAIDKSFRNKGLGLSLFKATMHACLIDNNDVIDTDLVEKNIVSQNFHDKLGFKLVNTLYTFHKWFK